MKYIKGKIIMKNKKLSLSRLTGAVIALVISSSVWAAVLPTENRLPAWGDYGTETVNFSDVYIQFVRQEQSKKDPVPSAYLGYEFRAESLTSSVFNLKSDNGYPDVGSFNGNMVISIDMSAKGRIRDGASFAVYSQDARFCNTAGKKCKAQLIYGGDVTGFGWSGTEGIIEFAISNRTGWAVDNWNPGSGSEAVEHILLKVPPFNIVDDSFGNGYTSVGDGFAVVVNSAP